MVQSDPNIMLLAGTMPVNRIAYGALHLLDAGPDAFGEPTPGVDSREVLRRVVDLGVNFIDTACIYGPGTNELQISDALAPYPDGLVISTKGGLEQIGPGQLRPNNRPDFLRAAIEGSLQRLKLDCIDLWTLHRIDPSIPVEETVGVLSNIQREGKIRLIGLSEATLDELLRATATAHIAVVQNRYNVADRRHDDVLAHCAAHGIGFVAWYPLAKGGVDLLSHCVGQIAQQRGVSVQRIALAWLLARSPVLIPIPGSSRLAEIEDNVSADRIHLTAGEMRTIEAQYNNMPSVEDPPSVIRSE